MAVGWVGMDKGGEGMGSGISKGKRGWGEIQ